MPVFSASIALDQFTTFGDLLKYLRRRAGLTQRELSIAVGDSDAQISRLENNEWLPDLANLFGAGFSPDGKRLVTAGADGSVRLYGLDQVELVLPAQERLTRGWMENECRQYLHVEKCP